MKRLRLIFGNENIANNLNGTLIRHSTCVWNASDAMKTQRLPTMHACTNASYLRMDNSPRPCERNFFFFFRIGYRTDSHN
jgi:hypothetical protein